MNLAPANPGCFLIKYIFIVILTLNKYDAYSDVIKKENIFYQKLN